MAETESHRRAKRKAPGKTEVKIKGGRRLDSASKHRATEIERSGDPRKLGKAVDRLRDSRKPQKVLQVPQKDMGKASDAMRQKAVGGTVKNMSGTKRRSIPKSKKRGK